MGVHSLFTFSEMGNALYLKRKRKVVELICLLCFPCLFNNVSSPGRCSSLPGHGVNFGLFVWGDELGLFLKVLWTPQNLGTPARERFLWVF